jgi:hypothetical protein
MNQNNFDHARRALFRDLPIGKIYTFGLALVVLSACALIAYVG